MRAAEELVELSLSPLLPVSSAKTTVTASTAARVDRHIRAPRAVVYQALLGPTAVGTWRVPDGLTSQVHEFDACEGGFFRVSLTYDGTDSTGNTSAHADTDPRPLRHGWSPTSRSSKCSNLRPSTPSSPAR